MGSQVTPQEIYTAVNNGTLTIIDRIDCLAPHHAAQVKAANAGDMNAAIAFAEDITRGPDGRLEWLWHVGYDNRATQTNRDDPEAEYAAISLNPAHALLLATLSAWMHQ